MWTYANIKRTKIKKIKEGYLGLNKDLEKVLEENKILKKRIDILIKLIEECGLEYKIKNTKKN